MKFQKMLLAAATVLLLTTSSAWAHDEGAWRAHTDRHGHWFARWFDHRHEHGHGHGLIKVPEINATSGTSSIALLTGVLLLAGERFRSRRS